MCGRFTLNQKAAALAEAFNLQQALEVEQQFNIAPTQMVLAVVSHPQSNNRELVWLRWGLIPPWAGDMSIGAKMINARGETVAEKPSFRSAFKHRRCLIVADGFYEWQRIDGKKQPYYFRLHSGQPFGLAGLWSKWQSQEGSEINSCTIITTEANELLQPIHHRMPVIIDPVYYDLWLNPLEFAPQGLQKLLCPYPSSAMTGYAVDTKVNNPTNNTPDCITPINPAMCSGHK